MTDDDLDREDRERFRAVMREFADAVRHEQDDAALARKWERAFADSSTGLDALFRDLLPAVQRESLNLGPRDGPWRELKATYEGTPAEPVDTVYDATGFGVYVSPYSGQTEFVIVGTDADGKRIGMGLMFRSQCRKLGRALLAIGSEPWTDIPAALADDLDTAGRE